MRTALVAILLASTAVLATACDLPLPGCGGYSGGNDRVLARGNDEMILCENGGFVVTLAAGGLQGRYADDDANSTIVHATMTNTSAVAFTLIEQQDGTSTAAELGAGVWTDVNLDQIAIDHANTKCVNLEAAGWWNTAPVVVDTGAEAATTARATAK